MAIRLKKILAMAMACIMIVGLTATTALAAGGGTDTPTSQPYTMAPMTLPCTLDAISGGVLVYDETKDSYELAYSATMDMNAVNEAKKKLGDLVDSPMLKISDMVTLTGDMKLTLTFPEEAVVAPEYQDPDTMKAELEKQLDNTAMKGLFMVDSATVAGNTLTAVFTMQKPDGTSVKGSDLGNLTDPPVIFTTPEGMLTLPKEAFATGKDLVASGTTVTNLAIGIPGSNNQAMFQGVLASAIQNGIALKEDFPEIPVAPISELDIFISGSDTETIEMAMPVVDSEPYVTVEQKLPYTLVPSGPQVTGNSLTYTTGVTEYPVVYTAEINMQPLQDMQELLRAAVDGKVPGKFSDQVTLEGSMITTFNFPADMIVANQYKNDTVMRDAMQTELEKTPMAQYFTVTSAKVDGNTLTTTFTFKEGKDEVTGAMVGDLTKDPMSIAIPGDMLTLPQGSYRTDVLKASSSISMKNVTMAIPEEYQTPLMEKINEMAGSPVLAPYITNTAEKPVSSVGIPIVGEADNQLNMYREDPPHPPTPTTKYTLTFNTNGGSAVSSITGSSGTTIQLTQTTSKNDYVFAGWYLDEALTQKVTEVTLNKNTTVYAKWEPKNTGADFDRSDHFAYIIGYEDGTVRPMANVTRGETATIFFRLLTDASRKTYWKTSNTFSDVNSSIWFNNAVSTVGNAGLVNGYEDGTFGGNKPITRAEFATIAVRANGGTGVYTGTNHFGDTSTSWANGYINQAVEMGLIAGYEDGTFRPNNYITRAEAMTLMNRFLGRDKVDATSVISGMITWPDNDETGAWYYYDVQEATNSHDYTRKSDNIEQWTAINAVKDWEALEKAWSTLNS